MLAAAGQGKPPTPAANGAPLLHLAQQAAATMTGRIAHADRYGKSRP